MGIKIFFHKKMKGKLVFKLVFVVVVVFAIIAGIILIKQNQNINENAAGIGCKNANSAKGCSTTCSPPKGKKDQSFKCRWTKNGECVESGKLCEARTIVTKWCGFEPLSVPAGQCGFSGVAVQGSSPCSFKDDKGNYVVLYCCPSGQCGYYASGNYPCAKCQ